MLQAGNLSPVELYDGDAFGSEYLTMRTQSLDTSPKIEHMQIVGLRAFPPAKKFASVRSISASMHFAALQSEVHGGSEYERAVTFLKRSSPASIVEAFRKVISEASEWSLVPFDILLPLVHVSGALDKAHVRYALAGTLARALYGFPRGVRTLEFLVDMEWQQAITFVQGLHDRQLIPGSDWWGGGKQSEPVRLLWLSSLVEIDLRFASEPPTDAAVLAGSPWLVLDQDVPPVPVLAPETCVLQGMIHYQATGACDDDLYNEILGVLKIQAPTLV